MSWQSPCNGAACLDIDGALDPAMGPSQLAVDAVHRAQDRVTVGAVAVEGAVAAGERGPLHGRDAMGEELRAEAGRLRR